MRQRVGQDPAELALQLLPGPVQAHVVEHVFQPGALAVGAVAVVAVQADHRLGALQQLARADRGDRRAHPGIGAGLGVGQAVAAAEIEVVALQLVALEHGEDAEVVGQDVDRVVLGHGQADLELPRQVGGAVQRLPP
jgi:hypothetical protein